jgi:hypothetical protein
MFALSFVQTLCILMASVAIYAFAFLRLGSR